VVEQFLRLPDVTSNDPVTRGLLSLACCSKADRYSRKYMIQGRVRLCEEQLESLRRELKEADREVLEVENAIENLTRSYFLQHLCRSPRDSDDSDHTDFPFSE
jgi:hypothetical protein